MVATGTHRPSREEELSRMLGVFRQLFRVVVHNAKPETLWPGFFGHGHAPRRRHLSPGGDQGSLIDQDQPKG